MPLGVRIGRWMRGGGLLRETGTVVAEHSVRERVEESYGPLFLRDQRRYGTTMLSFFSYKAEPQSEEMTENGAKQNSGVSRVL